MSDFVVLAPLLAALALAMTIGALVWLGKVEPLPDIEPEKPAHANDDDDPWVSLDKATRPTVSRLRRILAKGEE